MAAALPKKQVDLDAQIDEVIAKIDEALPKIHKRAAQARRQENSPSPVTSGFAVGNFMRTQQALSKIAREMKESADLDKVEIEIEMAGRRGRRRVAPPKPA